MSIHQCPKCELRFTWKTELDDHCHNDHPSFQHDYPVRRGRADNSLAPVDGAPAGPVRQP